MDNLINEKNDLSVRTIGLARRLFEDNNIELRERILLEKQLKHMEGYLAILKIRIEMESEK